MMVVMYAYWKQMPVYVSIPLGFLIAIVGSDFRMFKIALGLEDEAGQKPKNDSTDSDERK